MQETTVSGVLALELDGFWPAHIDKLSAALPAVRESDGVAGLRAERLRHATQPAST